MKIQVDSNSKIIKIEDTLIPFKELISYLDKLLPKDSPLGYWQEYSLETNTVIENWNNPIIIKETEYPYKKWDILPWNPHPYTGQPIWVGDYDQLPSYINGTSYCFDIQAGALNG